MPAPPKAKPPTPATPITRDRTSTVVTATLILLTALGVVTVFWEPLTALAVGTPAGETVGEARAPAADGGASANAPPSVGTAAADASTSS
jgi:hypothetical protein